MAKEKEYKVKVIKVLLKNNKTAKCGDLVKESQLINPHDAVKGGYVELVKLDKSKPKEEVEKDLIEGAKK